LCGGCLHTHPRTRHRLRCAGRLFNAIARLLKLVPSHLAALSLSNRSRLCRASVSFWAARPVIGICLKAQTRPRLPHL
jgi:hypothetical protein